jgi:SAM-dependent methyltransferase
LLADAHAIRTPTLVLTAGSDRVVKPSAQKRFFDGLSSPGKEVQIYPGFYHDIFHEADRHLPIAKARQFIRNTFESPPLRPWGKGNGATASREAQAESPSESHIHLALRRLFFSGLRLMLKSVGRLSRGIRIGWRSGFDSGESLDYVYENRARGITPLGTLLDRLYLNSIGWRGIRQRKANLERVLRASIEDVCFARRPVRVLDIASGPGRYILETFQALPHLEMSALLRDKDPKNLEAGRALARKMRVFNVTYVQGDAFDRRSLAAVTPAPIIAVVSGLYELFPDNDRISASLEGLHAALANGGYLIYTNQPWHPQLELIGRVLTNREGRPWLMRCRPQAEMDELVRAAGFQKVHTEIDEYGIFTVSVAQKHPQA